jgi:hypothetical protein
MFARCSVADIFIYDEPTIRTNKQLTFNDNNVQGDRTRSEVTS